MAARKIAGALLNSFGAGGRASAGGAASPQASGISGQLCVRLRRALLPFAAPEHPFASAPPFDPGARAICCPWRTLPEPFAGANAPDCMPHRVPGYVVGLLSLLKPTETHSTPLFEKPPPINQAHPAQHAQSEVLDISGTHLCDLLGKTRFLSAAAANTALLVRRGA